MVYVTVSPGAACATSPSLATYTMTFSEASAASDHGPPQPYWSLMPGSYSRSSNPGPSLTVRWGVGQDPTSTTPCITKTHAHPPGPPLHGSLLRITGVAGSHVQAGTVFDPIV